MGKLYNRAKMTVASAPGTGAITLGLPLSGFQSFSAAGVQNNDIVSYVLEDGANWEIGQGTYTSATTTLSRSVNASSSAGSAITASAGAIVYIAPLAADLQSGTSANNLVRLDASGKLPAVDGSQLTGLLTTVNNSNWSGAQLAIANGGTGLTSLGTGVATALGNAVNGVSGICVQDASGNLGLGVAPGAWSSGKAFDINTAGYGISAGYGFGLSLTSNAVYNGGFRYSLSAAAMRYSQNSGGHEWCIAPSGAAGSAISFTQAMTLDASGQLIIGNTSGSAPLHVYNTANSGWGAIVEKSAGSGTPHGLMAVVAQNSGSNYIFAAAQGSYASPNYKFVVTGAGQVGIGLSNPSYKLDIYDNVASPLIINAVNANTGGSSTAGYYMSHGAGTVGRMYVDNGSFIFGSFSNHALRIFTNSSESARIDASGNLMVNTTSAIGASKFSVSADTTNQNPMALANTRTTAATDYSLLLYRAGSIVGSIQTSLTATTYVTSSDASLKENIEDADSALASILALPIRKFDWKCDSSHTDYGLIAQEADNCAPEIVVKNELWSVEYGRITPRLIKAFQELAAKVSALEARQ